MNINEVIARINELAKKAKTEGLTEEELQERDKLRRIYIDNVKANLVGQLENTYIVSPDGTKIKVTRKQYFQSSPVQIRWGASTFLQIFLVYLQEILPFFKYV